MKSAHVFYLCLAFMSLCGGCSKRRHNDPTPTCPSGCIIIKEEIRDSLYETQIGLIGGKLRFSSSLHYSSYSWKIGTDARTFTDSTVSLFFNQPNAMTVPVRLIGVRDVLPCRPGDTGVDTLETSFRMLPAYSSPMFGTWRGNDVGNPGVPYNVRIWKWPNPDGICNTCVDTLYSVSGFAKEYQLYRVEPDLGGMNALWTTGGGQFENSYGESVYNCSAHLTQGLDSIVIQYLSVPLGATSPLQVKHRTYIGVRQ